MRRIKEKIVDCFFKQRDRCSIRQPDYMKKRMLKRIHLENEILNVGKSQ